MKRLNSAVTLFSLGIVLMGISSCLKDDCRRTFTLYSPVFKSLTEIRAGMKSESPQELINTGKLYVYGRYLLINELGKGIHILDNANPSDPKNISFINIPGNMDMAVRNNYLYADSYSDLVVFDMADPLHVAAKKFIENVFQERQIYYWNGSQTSNPDSIMIVTDYARKDTTVDCSTYNSWGNCRSCPVYADASGRNYYSAPITGIGGSMARFTIMDHFLYSVTYSELFTFDLSNATEPELLNKNQLGSWQVETIFPFRDKLFIGSTNGMFIYDVSNPSSPSALGTFSHVQSCDPVIADQDHAFVTLRSGTPCQGFANQLEILDIADLANPLLLQTYSLFNPHGLSKDENWLFICDGDEGLKVYDARDINNLELKQKIEIPGTFDVIAINHLAMVIAKEGLYQYDYSDINDIKFLSKVEIGQ